MLVFWPYYLQKFSFATNIIWIVVLYIDLVFKRIIWDMLEWVGYWVLCKMSMSDNQNYLLDRSFHELIYLICIRFKIDWFSFHCFHVYKLFADRWVYLMLLQVPDQGPAVDMASNKVFFSEFSKYVDRLTWIFGQYYIHFNPSLKYDPQMLRRRKRQSICSCSRVFQFWNVSKSPWKHSDISPKIAK